MLIRQVVSEAAPQKLTRSCYSRQLLETTESIKNSSDRGVVLTLGGPFTQCRLPAAFGVGYIFRVRTVLNCVAPLVASPVWARTCRLLHETQATEILMAPWNVARIK